jgi:hypothetical protein
MSDNALKIPLQTSLRSFSSARTNDFQQSQAQSIPMQVTKTDKDFVYASFQPSNGIFTMPVIKISQSFSAYQREPTQIKEQGNAVPSNYYTGGVTGLGGGNADFQPRGNLTTLSYQPINRTVFPDRDYQQHHIAGGPNGVKIIQANPPTPPPTTGQPNPQRTLLNNKLTKLSTRARQAWQNSRTPVAKDGTTQSTKLAYMQIDKNGLITHLSPSGDHSLTVDEQNRKVTVNTPLSSMVYLGGDGKTGTYDLVVTLSGPAKNVMARTG